MATESNRPSGPGFGVDPGQLHQVCRQYDTEGAELVAIRDTVEPGVGTGQLGRGFHAVAAPYRQAFERFGRNVVAFGEATRRISDRLAEVGADYAGTDEANLRRIRGVD